MPRTKLLDPGLPVRCRLPKRLRPRFPLRRRRQFTSPTKPGAAQSVVRSGHLTVPRRDPRFMSLNVFNYIFGGQFGARLNMNLRQDKGYSYGYMSSIEWNLGPSMLIAGGGVQTAVTKETVIETLKEFNEILGDRPVTESEYRDAIDGIMRSIPSQFETQFQIISQLTRIVTFDLPDDYFTQYPMRPRRDYAGRREGAPDQSCLTSTTSTSSLPAMQPRSSQG